MFDRRPFGIAVLIVFSIAHVGASCTPQPPASSETVVFDIDGTLTPSTLELLDVRAGAVEAVEAYLDLGYHVVLLTARWDALFEVETLAWLALYHFPVAEIQLEMSPTWLFSEAETIEFKQNRLAELTDDGLDFVHAYGDSSTDFEAYTLTGIPFTEVFATLRNLESECQPGDWAECLTDFVDHVTSYIDEQPVAQ